jgi:tetratricopeptide (TPR) repeat protein
VNYDIAIQKRDDGEYRSALVFLDRAIEAAETKHEVYRDAYRLKGETLSLMGKGGEAVEYLERSLNDEEDPPLYDNDFSYNNSEKASYYTLAKISLSLGDRDKAIEYLNEALEIYPDDASLERLMEEAGGSKPEDPEEASPERDRFGSA